MSRQVSSCTLKVSSQHGDRQARTPFPRTKRTITLLHPHSSMSICKNNYPYFRATWNLITADMLEIESSKPLKRYHDINENVHFCSRYPFPPSTNFAFCNVRDGIAFKFIPSFEFHGISMFIPINRRMQILRYNCGKK